jgi:hypothetical protein
VAGSQGKVEQMGAARSRQADCREPKYQTRGANCFWPSEICFFRALLGVEKVLATFDVSTILISITLQDSSYCIENLRLLTYYFFLLLLY